MNTEGLKDNIIVRVPLFPFLLADDPSAGKTIMAGLLIKRSRKWRITTS